ncbi:MAG TPA: hypothetical protein VGM43_10525 [Bryobacteraceae bacterium]|jgi:hypothetical protein
MEDVTDILQLIHGAGYWRVHLRPSVFHSAQIRSKDDCLSLINHSAISTEGWRYPIINGRTSEEGADWIAEAANTSVFIEYWRFYQSGQFIHHLALREDHMRRLNLFHPQFFAPSENRRYLAITSTICMLTDVIEFAARLAYRQILTPRAVINIELNNMAGRELVYMQPGRQLPASFWFKDEIVSVGGTYEPEQLIGKAADVAIQLSLELFKKALWEPPRTLIVDDQARYTANRR